MSPISPTTIRHEVEEGRAEDESGGDLADECGHAEVRGDETHSGGEDEEEKYGVCLSRAKDVGRCQEFEGPYLNISGEPNSGSK